MSSVYWLGFKKILGFLKKALIVFVVFFAVVYLFFYTINKNRINLYSQNDPIEENRKEIYRLINDEKINSTKEGKTVISLYRNTLCLMIGEACTDNPKDGDTNFNRSVFGFVSNLITLPFAQPPASGFYWAYSGLLNAGFLPKTYAATGIGLAAISPLINIWKVFRDVSYFLLVVVLIAIGFMIMLRMKLNPQTVISVENALPKIVVSLILITFSFPIAGFLIDFMYFIIAFSLMTLGSNTVLGVDVNFYYDRVLGGTSSALFNDVFGNRDLWTVGPAIFHLLPTALSIILRMILMGITIWSIFNFLPPAKQAISGEVADNGVWSGGVRLVVAFIMSLILGPLLAIYAPLILSLLVFLTALFVFFRIFFTLFGQYVTIILLIIFSPLIFLFEAIPGKSSFSFWFKNLFACLLAYPVTVVLILISSIICRMPSTAQPIWSPPFFLPDPKSANAFTALIGVGILFVIPDIIKLVKELLGAKGLGVSFGLGTFFGGVGMAFGGVQGIAGMGTSLTQLPFLGQWINRQAWTDSGEVANKGIFGKIARGFVPPPISASFSKSLEKAGFPPKP